VGEFVFKGKWDAGFLFPTFKCSNSKSKIVWKAKMPNLNAKTQGRKAFLGLPLRQMVLLPIPSRKGQNLSVLAALR
jgi:hypothetical protein